jgi:hypothetical protein
MLFYNLAFYREFSYHFNQCFLNIRAKLGIGIQKASAGIGISAFAILVRCRKKMLNCLTFFPVPDRYGCC